MIQTILCVTAVTLGVQYGWEPNNDGGLEYIVQIDKDSLKNLGQGIPFRSDFPRDLQGLQTIRFQVGATPPPQIALPLPTISPSSQQPAKLAENPGGKPLAAQKAVFEETNKTDDPQKPVADAEKNVVANEEKPWPQLYAALGTATGLAAAFCYLLWLHIGMRARYRMLLAEHLALGRET